METIQEEKKEIIVKKEKVLREFRDELKLKGIENREVYDEPFFKILNHVYQYQPKNITCHLKKEWLTFLLTFEHKYISIAYSQEFVILSITDFKDHEKGGIFTIKLEDAFKKMDKICKKKT